MAATRATTRPRKPARPSSNGKPNQIHELKEESQFRRFLIYSEPGAGKSTLAASSAALGKTLIMNADRPDALDTALELGYKPDVWEFNSYKDLDEAYEFLRHGGYKEYEWFWLDTATIAQDKGMDQIMRELVAKHDSRSLYLPDKAQYQENQNRLSMWVRNMSRMHINFGMTAHVLGIVDEEDGETRYMPAFQGGRGNLSNKISANVGVVGRLYTTRVRREVNGKQKQVRVRALQVQPTAKYYAKGPIALGNEVPNPTMEKLMEMINKRSSK